MRRVLEASGFTENARAVGSPVILDAQAIERLLQNEASPVAFDQKDLVRYAPAKLAHAEPLGVRLAAPGQVLAAVIGG